MLQKIVRFVIYASSVLISAKYAAGYWVVGPVFGLAVVAYRSQDLKKLFKPKDISFLIASTLIYAFVYHISSQNWNYGSDLADSLYGSFPIAVITGSVLLPLAHQMIFGANAKTFKKAVVALIASYYLVTLVSMLRDVLTPGLSLNLMLLLVGAWQGTYLCIFFSPKGER